jgi:hypothetical protein
MTHIKDDKYGRLPSATFLGEQNLGIKMGTKALIVGDRPTRAPVEQLVGPFRVHE